MPTHVVHMLRRVIAEVRMTRAHVVVSLAVSAEIPVESMCSAAAAAAATSADSSIGVRER